MIKYIVVPGYIKSINDNDMHWISAKELLRLHNVKKEECIVVENKFSLRGYSEEYLLSLKVLGPQHRYK